MSPLEIPQEARAILALIQRTAPQAVIAGGYLRDLHAGVAPKDIDVFVPAPYGPLLLPPPFKDTCSTIYRTGEGYNGGMREEVVWVGEIPTDWLPVQVIVYDPEVCPDLLSSFDFDFCQVTFDGHELYSTTAFRDAMKTKRARFMRGDHPNEMARSARRVERWAERYPDWSFDLMEPAAWPQL